MKSKMESTWKQKESKGNQQNQKEIKSKRNQKESKEATGNQEKHVYTVT